MRDGVRDDADDLAAAHTEGWRVAYRGIVPDDFLDDPEFAAQRLRMWRAWTWPDIPTNRLIVVDVHGRTVGFSLFGPERDQHSDEHDARDGDSSAVRGEVYAFYIHPDVWGSGAAQPLMERTHERLRAEGFSAAVLWVLRDNPRARAFYAKCGWAYTGLDEMWEGPSSSSRVPSPIPEVQYAVVLASEAAYGSEKGAAAV